ncbi:MAG: hypothetical protein ACLTDP_07705 [Terrisporobacter sp.]
MGFISTNNLNLSFRLSMDYYTSIAVFDEKDRLILKNNLIKSEQNHGLNKLGEEGIYSYNHPDYLYLYATLNNLRNNYNMNYDTDFWSCIIFKRKTYKRKIFIVIIKSINYHMCI